MPGFRRTGGQPAGRVRLAGTWRPRADSDLDLLVVEPFVADRFAEMARLSALLGKKMIPADVVVMSAENFDRQKNVTNTLAWRAAREGMTHELAA